MLDALFQYTGTRSPEQVRGYVSAPTGSGKTVLFTRFLEELRQHSSEPLKTLIVVPTTQLVEQTQTALVTHGFTGAVRRTEGWKEDKGDFDAMVTTYAGFSAHLRRSWEYALKPDNYSLVIFDEAHHLQGEQTQRILKERFAHAMQLGFTATPDYDMRRQLANILPDEIHRIQNSEAVQEGLISPFATLLLATNTDMSSVKILGTGEYDSEDMDRVLNIAAV